MSFLYEFLYFSLLIIIPPLLHSFIAPSLNPHMVTVALIRQHIIIIITIIISLVFKVEASYVWPLAGYGVR